MKRYTDNDTELSSEAVATADMEADWNRADSESENASENEADFISSPNHDVTIRD